MIEGRAEALGFKAFHTQFGEFEYFSRINLKNNTIEGQDKEQFLNLTNPGEGAMNFLIFAISYNNLIFSL